MKVKTSFFLFFLTFLSCNKINEFDLLGHRGYRGLYPENSTIGFLKSLHVGVNTIELDVVISKDKQVVVSHEPWISKNICIDQNGNRIINDKEDFNIYSMEYNDIKKFDCGIIGNDKFPNQKKISVFKPTLNHIIKTVENYIKEKKYKTVNYNIEIKSSDKTDLIFHPDVKEFSDLVVNVIKNKKILERTTVQSFDFRVLKYLNKNYCICIPTETVYGLAANAYIDSAVNKIFKLKRRPKKNPLIVHYLNMNYLSLLFLLILFQFSQLTSFYSI